MIGLDGWIDHHIAQSCHPILCSFLNFIILFLNRLGKGDALFFLCLVLIIVGYFASKSRFIKSGSVGIIALISSGILVQTLKHLFGRARPQMNMGDLHFIGPHFFKDGFDSFPSGHALSTFTMASFFSYFYPRYRILFYSTAAAICIFGRVLMRHHFLSDVIVGGILGVCTGIFFSKKFKGWIEKDPLCHSEQSEESRPAMTWQEKKKTQHETHIPEMAHGNSPATNSRMIDLFIIIAFSSIILFTGLSNSALWDRDETEYAQATIEMNQKNEWLIPTLEGESFVEKPVLLYWCTRISTKLFGINEFAFRFPSVIFGILTCLATYFLGRKIGRGKTGFFSALILSSSFLFAGGIRLLMTDPLFVFFSTLAFLFYMHSIEKQKFILLAYISIGLSVLSKGPIGFFPVIVFVLYEWLHKKSFSLKTIVNHSLLSLIPVLIAAPWFIYSFSTNKTATSSFFIYDNFLRFFEGMEGHTGPMFYYILVLLIGFFPWSFFLIPYIQQEWKKRVLTGKIMESEILLLSLWFSFLFIFFSITANKLPHYILPAMPPLACLLGRFWNDQLHPLTLPSPIGRGVGVRGNISSLKPFIASSLTFCALIIFALISLYWIRPQYASLKLIFPFLTLLLLLCLSYQWNKNNKPREVFYSVSLSSLFLFVTFSLWGLPWIEKHRVAKPIGLAIKKHASPDSKVFGYHFSEPSLFIYGEKLFPKIENQSLDDLLNQSEPSYVVITESKLKELSPNIPYEILEQKKGFAENSGEITLMLIKNRVKLKNDRSPFSKGR